MWKLQLLALATVLALPVLADDDPLRQQLQNQQQLQEVEQRLKDFYQADQKQNLQQMQQTLNQKPVKYSAQTGKPLDPKKLQQTFSLEQQLKKVQQELSEAKTQKQIDKLKAQQQELQTLQEQAKQNPLIQAGQAKLTQQYDRQQAKIVSSQQRVDALQEELGQVQQQQKQAQQQADQEKDQAKKKQLQQQAQKLLKQQQRLAKQVDKVKKLQQEDGRAGILPNDRVEDLVDSWVDDSELVKDLNVIGKKYMAGKAEVTPWSDDYWALTNGTTAWRYGAATNEFKNWLGAVSFYVQPDAWTANPTKDAADWSPAEKYDIAVGDVGNGSKIGTGEKMLSNLENWSIPGFTLTRSQKAEGLEYWQDNHKVEDWMGICHGWAPASVVVSRPVNEVTVDGALGADKKPVKVKFYAHDIRGLSSLQYANGNYSNSFIGGRCNAKKATLLRNGRISDQDCFDNNPATWHLALVNFLGLKKQAFVGDGTFDYEVWNNPITQYEFTYFNPKNPSQRSKDWSKVAVAYKDPAFAKTDRFRMGKKGSPTYTRGVTARGDLESEISKVVGVIATVHWIAEVTPVKGAPAPDDYNVVTYTYDLEINEHNEPIGGEWHENTHPDFLWMPRRGSLARNGADGNLTYNGSVTANLTTAAQRASKSGYPLNAVLKYLVSKSAAK